MSNEHFKMVLQHGYARDITIPCLQSIAEHGGLEDLVLVDNASPDDSAQVVQDIFPKVPIIRNEQNVPWAMVCNEIAKSHSQYKYISFLNNDLFFKGPFFEKAKGVLDSFPEVKMASCKMFTEHPFGDWESYAYVDRQSIIHTRYDPRPLVFLSKPPHYVCPLFLETKTFLDMGGFDENFKFAWEEVDYTFRLYEKGLQVASINSSYAIHWGHYTRVRTNINSLWDEQTKYFKEKWASLLATLPEQIGKP